MKFCFRHLFVLLLGALCVFGSTAAVAGNLGYVKRSILRLSRVLEIEAPNKRTAKLVREFHRSFAYAEFEARVVKDAKSKFSAQERKRFSAAFEKMFEKKILGLANEPSIQCSDYKVSQGTKPLDVSVACVQGSSTEKITLHFSPVKRNKIIDITYSGALLSRNYRGIINKILRRDGAAALIKKIESKSSQSLTEKSLL